MSLFLTFASGVLQQYYLHLVEFYFYCLGVLVKLCCIRSQFLLLAVVFSGAIDVVYVK